MDLVLRSEDDTTTGAGASADANYNSNDKDTGNDKTIDEDIIRNIQHHDGCNDDYDDMYDDIMKWAMYDNSNARLPTSPR